MTYTRDSPILGGDALTAGQLWQAFAPMTPPGETARARQALGTIAELCRQLGIDPLAACAIAWIETGEAGTGLPFRSRWWIGRNNLGNLGVTGDPAQDAASQHWTTPGDGAVALMAHLTAYAYGDRWAGVWDVNTLGNPRVWDRRFDLVLASTGGQPITTLGGLNNRWAVDAQNDYGGKLAERANRLQAAITNPPVSTPSTPAEPAEQEKPVATPQYLDYSSLSFPVEVRLIPASHTHQRTGLGMTPAYSTWHDTDNTNAGATAEMHADWMFDGCRNDRGEVTDTSWHFTVDDHKAIQHIPLNEVAWHAGDGYNGPGNRTSIAIEECVNRDRDAAKTRANAAELHALVIKELDLQGGTVNALKQHNFWSGKDCPLAIRRAGLWPAIVNKVTECIARIGGTPSYAQAHPVAKGSQVINEHQFLAPGGKTFQRDTIPAEWGDGLDNPTGPTIKKGTVITQDNISHYVQGTDGNLYLVLTGIPGVADGSRVPADAVIAQ